ncbi:MAG: GNAT family N-acetyltransferase [Bacteroidales bacterium]|nr:GNAT family N-acetyltransferase [Bacteroidales bacterium]
MIQMPELREIPLSSGWFRRKAADFLEARGLALDANLDTLFGLYDAEDRLCGCAGRDGNVIKCVAVDESLRGMNATSLLISPLINEILEDGESDVLVFTKPENRAIFESMGFHLVGEAPVAIMMESDPEGIASHCRRLSALTAGKPGPVGVILLNANPLTRGHEYLIRRAADSCATLVLIPLAANKNSKFSEEARTEALRRLTESIPSAILAPASPYSISAATFPSYFIKDPSEAARNQMVLELNIFTNHLAPAIGAKVRFVGTEPSDALTSQYNALMKETLPKHGITVDEIDRLCDKHGQPYSASRVRQAIDEERLGDALQMIAPEAVPALLAEAASQALLTELDLTPKPGLVDRGNSGPHKDMTPFMMEKSIRTLTPYFRRMADVTFFNPQPTAAELVAIGNEAEKDMLSVSGGVNTHRGALFSLGIAVAAAARLIAKRVLLNDMNLRAEIAVIAEALPASKGEVRESNGQEVIRKYHIKGAHKNACEAYPQLFDEWLPEYTRMRREGISHPLHRLLLLIIASLEDSNAYHRAGSEGADFAHKAARECLDNFSEENLERLDREFTQRNISAGGAADMLALTIFIYSLLNAPSQPE